MSPTNQVHVKWIIAILIVTNVILATVRWGDNTRLVEHFNFAATLASLLAILANAYAKANNTDITRHLGPINHAADQLSAVSSDLARTVAGLNEKLANILLLIGEVGERVQETHGLVKNLQNAPNPAFTLQPNNPESNVVTQPADEFDRAA